ncbi:MAG: Rubrerythrin [Pseudomonadota bacterium]|jgi:rubrerythrin
MTTLKGSRTEQALRDAFAWESQANRRYVYFANQAEEEGHADLAALFRSSAQGETGHAMGHLEFLQQVGDPVTGLPIGNTLHNLASALHSEIRESTEMYPAMAKVAREEGFNDVADWFETLAKAEQSHAQRYTKAIESLKQD